MSGVKPASLQFTPAWHHSLSDYVTGLAWLPDLQWLVATSADGGVVLYSDQGDAVTLQSPDGLAINCLGVSADGRYVAVGGQSSNMTVWEVLPEPSMVLRQSYVSAWIDTLSWHPTRPWVAYGVGQTVEVLDVVQNQAIATLDFQDSSVLHLDWHPAGDRLAVSGHGGVKVWSSEDWTAEPTAIEVPGASLYCAWSAEGRYLGSGNLDRTLTVAEWNSPPPWLMQGFPGKVRQLDWSTPTTASGSPMIAAACVEGITLWERRGQGRNAWKSRVLQYHSDRVNAIAFLPDSVYLASAGQDGRIALWRDGKTLDQTLKGMTAGASCLAWAPSKTMLAAGGTAGEVQTWRISRRAQGFG